MTSECSPSIILNSCILSSISFLYFWPALSDTFSETIFWGTKASHPAYHLPPIDVFICLFIQPKVYGELLWSIRAEKDSRSEENYCLWFPRCKQQMSFNFWQLQCLLYCKISKADKIGNRSILWLCSWQTCEWESIFALCLRLLCIPHGKVNPFPN